MNKPLFIRHTKTTLLITAIALSFASLVALPALAKTEDKDVPPTTSNQRREIKDVIEETVLEVREKIDEVSAVEATDEQTLEEIKKRIEKTVEEKSAQVKGVMEALTSERKAIIGEVERVTSETITIVNKSGRHILPVTPKVSFLKANKAIEYSEVAVGNWVNVLGVMDEKGDLTPKYIEVYTESLQPDPQIVLLGSIQAIDNKTITVVSRYDQTVRSFTINKDSEFQDVNGVTVPADDFITDMNVLLIGTETTDKDGGKQVILNTVRSLAPLAQQSPSSKTAE